MYRYLSILLILTISSLLVSCVKESQVITPAPLFPYVDEELWPYFSAFEDAAASVGLHVDLTASGISGKIQEIQSSNVAGQCSYSRSNPGDVVVDESFWKGADYLAREMIVFHELGHCYLHRSHVEDAFASGRCSSIMRSGTCCCWDAYTAETRPYYIQELFGEGGMLAAN